LGLGLDRRQLAVLVPRVAPAPRAAVGLLRAAILQRVPPPEVRVRVRVRVRVGVRMRVRVRARRSRLRPSCEASSCMKPLWYLQPQRAVKSTPARGGMKSMLEACAPGWG
jgi:hypothetical protein